MCTTENTPLAFPTACSLCWKSRVHWWAEESAFCGLPSRSPVCPSPGNHRRWRSAGVQAHRQQHAGTCRRTTVTPSPQSYDQDKDGITVGHFLSMDWKGNDKRTEADTDSHWTIYSWQTDREEDRLTDRKKQQDNESNRQAGGQKERRGGGLVGGGGEREKDQQKERQTDKQREGREKERGKMTDWSLIHKGNEFRLETSFTICPCSAIKRERDWLTDWSLIHKNKYFRLEPIFTICLCSPIKKVGGGGGAEEERDEHCKPPDPAALTFPGGDEPWAPAVPTPHWACRNATCRSAGPVPGCSPQRRTACDPRTTPSCGPRGPSALAPPPPDDSCPPAVLRGGWRRCLCCSLHPQS